MSDQPVKKWRCKVCGYIHRGPEPPEECPVCGSPKTAFEPYVEKAPTTRDSGANRYRCMVCGYFHRGSAPPDECPVCGAKRDRFEPAQEQTAVSRDAAQKGRTIIVGAGVAGLSAAEALREASTSAEILLISKEPHLPYYRLNLTRYLDGEVTEGDLPIHPQEWYDGNDIKVMTGVEVSSIDAAGKTVELSRGGMERYDKLILANGSHPFVPPMSGCQREGITTFRTVEDASRMLGVARGGGRCLCIGGGILGLETAGALARQGAEVTVIEGSSWLMPRQLNEEGGRLLQKHVEGMGIRLCMGVRVSEILGDHKVRGVALDNEIVLDADLVIVTAGIRPNSYLARPAGLEVRRGVVVNDYLETSHPDILAAGDVTEHRGVIYGIWPASQYQGSIAGMNAAGKEVEFAGIPRSNSLKVLDISLMSVGTVEPEDASFREVAEQHEGTYLRYLFHDSFLVGAIAIGDDSISSAAREAIESHVDFSDILDGNVTAASITSALLR